MRVGVEGIPLFGSRTGVGQYEKNLLEAASRRSKDIDFEVTRQLMPHRRLVDYPIKPNPHLSYHIVRWLPPIFYYQLFKRLGWTLPYDLVLHRRYDAVVFFNFVAYPVSRRTKTVVVVHDLSYIYHQQYVSPKNQAWLEKFVPKSIRKANKIIAVSENTKKEIAEHYKIPAEKIEVITPAVNHSEFYPRQKTEIEQVKKRFGINKPYILSVATQEPRKNLIGVLAAYEQLPEALKQKFALVLVGGKGWLDAELQAKYNAISKDHEVIRTGYVDDADLPPLYSGASLFVYPSFYEGFGIPALEAMACGVPVITSNNSSLPEVVGDAAIKIKAGDTAAIAKAMKQILNGSKTAEALHKKGLARAQRFSWDKSADKLLKLLDLLSN